MEITEVRLFLRREDKLKAFATVTFDNGQTALQQVWADARRFDELLRASIDEALKDIESYERNAA